MRINHPVYLKGKIILQYRGTNIVLRDIPSSSDIRDVELIHRVTTFGNTSEKFPLLLNLFDGTRIMLAFNSRSIYWKTKAEDKEFWICDNQSKVIENEILIDSENIFIIGKFTFLKNLSLSDVRSEEYHYTAIFKSSKTMVDELLRLKTNKVIANDFKYVQNISE